MITGTFIVVALILGYVVAVGLSMMAAFGITKTAPAFVVKDHLLKPGYRFLQELIWFVCATAGGYVSAWVTGSSHPWLVGAGLAVCLIAILWTNTWEVAQRGLGHQMAMSLVTIAGVIAGFALHLR